MEVKDPTISFNHIMYLLRVVDMFINSIIHYLIVGPKRMALHTDELAKCVSARQENDEGSVT